MAQWAERNELGWLSCAHWVRDNAQRNGPTGHSALGRVQVKFTYALLAKRYLA